MFRQGIIAVATMLLVAAAPIPAPKPTDQGQPQVSETQGRPTQQSEKHQNQPSPPPGLSAHTPLYVQASCEHGCGYAEGDKGWWQKFWTDPNATFAGLLFLLTVGLVVSAFLQWSALIKQDKRLKESIDKAEASSTQQSKDMQASIVAMKDVAAETANIAVAAAQSATTAVRALLTTERAFVFMKYLSTYPLYLNQITGETVGYVLSPVWTNSGTTPARYCKLNVGWCAQVGDLPNSFAHPYDREAIETTIGPNSEVHGGLIEIDRSSWNALVSKTKQIYVWGTAEYRDIFNDTSLHFTHFCVRMNLIRSGGPNAQEFLGFVPYGPFNYTDKER